MSSSSTEKTGVTSRHCCTGSSAFQLVTLILLDIWPDKKKCPEMDYECGDYSFRNCPHDPVRQVLRMNSCICPTDIQGGVSATTLREAPVPSQNAKVCRPSRIFLRLHSTCDYRPASDSPLPGGPPAPEPSNSFQARSLQPARSFHECSDIHTHLEPFGMIPAVGEPDDIQREDHCR